MEFVFLPYSAHGHVSPMLGVAEELVRRGAQVRVIAGAGYRSRVESAGAQLVSPPVGHNVRVPAGRSPRELRERIELWCARRNAWRSTQRTVVAEVRRNPHAVYVADPHVSWALTFLRQQGVPFVPFWTTHSRAAGRAGVALVNLLPELLPRGGSPGRHAHLVGPLTGPVAPTGPAIDWRRLGERLIVVSPGTVFDRPAGFFRGIVDEFAGRREWAVVLAAPRLDAVELGALPSNVSVQQWIPQRQLLRDAEVFITHGGINSVHEALLAGVPMLSSPRTREQRITSIRLREMGIGTLLPRSGVRAAAEGLVGDPRVRRLLSEVQDRALAARGAERAADLLLEIGKQARHAVPMVG